MDQRRKLIKVVNKKALTLEHTMVRAQKAKHPYQAAIRAYFWAGEKVHVLSGGNQGEARLYIKRERQKQGKEKLITNARERGKKWNNRRVMVWNANRQKQTKEK